MSSRKGCYARHAEEDAASAPGLKQQMQCHAALKLIYWLYCRVNTMRVNDAKRKMLAASSAWLTMICQI